MMEECVCVSCNCEAAVQLIGAVLSHAEVNFCFSLWPSAAAG